MSSSSAKNFPDYFLDQIRSAIPVSEIVGRDVHLKSKGSGGEFLGLSPFNNESSASFTVNDPKGFYHCFSSGQHGDVFDWIMIRHGLSFPQAVEQLSKEAGLDPIRVDREPGYTNGSPYEPRAQKAKPEIRLNGQNEPRPEPKVKTPRKLAATYTYADAEGRPLYKVQRWEWYEDDKRCKSFSQHRMVEDGRYADSISAGFYRPHDHGWKRLRTGEEPHEGDVELAAVKHGLYKLPEINEAMAAGRTIVVCEGEKDCETLWTFGIPATTNSGGSTNWRHECDVALKGADVVIAFDNDDPGRKWKAELFDALSGVAKRVRVLDIAKHWPGCPPKGDVTDWVEKGGATAEKIKSVLAALSFESELGFVLWGDIERASDNTHQELVQDWLTAGEVGVLAGTSQAGKTFFAIELGMAVARGIPFLDKHPVMQGLVLYQAGEGARGIRFMRVPAYRIDKGISREDPIPFAVLDKPIDLHNNGDAVVEALIRDAKAAERATGYPCRLLVIDTTSAATPGADENSAKDIGPVLNRCTRLTRDIGCAVLLLTHLNAQATKIRGWTGFVANVETTFVCREIEGTFDTAGRPLREVEVTKQKDGERGRRVPFVLRGVQVGYKPDGSPRYSCVIDKPASGDSREDEAKKAFDRMNLTDQCMLYFTSIQEAIDQYGQPPPKELDHKVPITARVVDMKYVREIFDSKWTGESVGSDARDAAQRQARKRHGQKLQVLDVIGVSVPWMWLTGKRVGANKVRPDATDDHASRHAQDLPPDDEPLF